MQQITKQDVIDFIEQNHVELKPTQSKLCLPIINRLYRKMSIGIKFSGIHIAEGLIIDGHHRYLASLLANFHLEQIPSRTTSATIVIEWNVVDFVEKDWDTPAKIQMLNERDAAYNVIPLDKIIDLLK